MKTLLVAILILGCLCEAKLQQPYNELQFNTNSVSKRSSANSPSDAHQRRSFQFENKDDQTKQNDIDDRILIGEPYKSLIQTTTRFALSNTQVGKHLNIDVMMNFLNDAGYLIAKPSVLINVVKACAATLVTFTVGLFLMPGAPQFIEAVWRNPVKAFGLKKYTAINGMYDKSIMTALNMRTEELVGRVGLDDVACRQKTLCHAGETIKLLMPRKSRAAVQFFKDNFPNIRISDEPNLDAFTAGLVTGKCPNVSPNESRKNSSACLGEMMDLFLNTVGVKRVFDE